MTRVSGYSDDLVYLECDSVTTEIPVEYKQKVFVEFEDETVVSIYYGVHGAVWSIDVIERGTAGSTLHVCPANSDDEYSDSFEIDEKWRRFRWVD